MPLLDNIEFKPLPVPDEVKSDTEVFYLSTTCEVFTDYDKYFDRIVQLNSSIWTCSATRKHGLTFDEAKESEEIAWKELEELPDYFKMPIIYLIYKFSYRAQIADLHRDIFKFVKCRYFINEIVYFEHEKRSKKKKVKILNVTYDETLKSDQNEIKTKDKSPKKSPIKNIVPTDETFPLHLYRYKIEVINDSSFSSDNSDDEESKLSTNQKLGQVIENVLFTQLSRSRNFSLKQYIKLLIIHNSEFIDSRQTVKESIVKKYNLGRLNWNNIFAGPTPYFQDKDSPKKIKKEFFKRESTTSRQSIDKSATDKNLKNKQMLIIKQQQETLAPLINEAERYGVENVGRWKQNFVVLSEDDIYNLKEAVKEGKELERKKVAEQRKKEKEESKKIRDDLQRDDLKPLPVYEEFLLPEWIPTDLYFNILSIYNFLNTFSNVFDLDKPVTLSWICVAIVSKNVNNQKLYKIFKTLLTARMECADSEDGDEADVDNAGEIGNEADCELDNKTFKNLVREVNKRHEALRNTFGTPVRQLPILWETVTEVVRLTLETSGYYTSDNVKMRQTMRGNLKCYEDEGFIFAQNNPELMNRLKYKTLYELEPKERIALIQVFIQQLLNYQKFREIIEERGNNYNDLKKELRLLKDWNRVQERESREARAVRLDEAKKAKKSDGGDTNENDKGNSKKNLKELQKLRSYLDYLNAGRTSRRGANANFELEMKRMILESIPYAEMQLHEIEEFRQLQRELYNEKINELLRKIYKAQARMGQCCLGQDRAFRSYYFLHCFRLLIIKTSLPQEITPCDEPTPIRLHEDNENRLPLKNKIVYDSKIVKEEQTTSDDKERILRTACTGKRFNCPVHNLPNYSKFYYFIAEKGIEKLLESLNLRGIREMELAENIESLKDIYEEKMESLLKDANSEVFLMRHLAVPQKLNDEDDEIDVTQTLKNDFCDKLLKLEERVHFKGFGSVICNKTREEWRRSLEEKGDTTHLCNNNELIMEIGSEKEILFNSEQLKNLTSVQKLSVALLQIVNGISLDFIVDPFVGKVEKSMGNLPTVLFVKWQKEVTKCESISALSLFMTILKNSIAWKLDAIDFCHGCEKKMSSCAKIVKCRKCKRSFHFFCTNLKPSVNKLTISMWKCNRSDCLTESMINEKRRGRPKLFEKENKNSKEKKMKLITNEETDEEEKNKSSAEEDESNEDETAQDEEVSDENENKTQEKKLNEANGFANVEENTMGKGGRLLRSTNNATSSRSLTNINQRQTYLNGNAKDYLKSSSQPDDDSCRKRRSAAKKYVDYIYSEKSDESESDSSSSLYNSKRTKLQKSTSNERNLRKKPPSSAESLNFRHVNMELRESDDQKKLQLKRCESIIREGMRQSFGEPFAYPVDAKLVPDYYNIIKNPIDMRTMINKIKNFEYTSADNLWSDCELMFANCEEFNEDGLQIREDANELRKFLKSKFELILGKRLC